MVKWLSRETAELTTSMRHVGNFFQNQECPFAIPKPQKSSGGSGGGGGGGGGG